MHSTFAMRHCVLALILLLPPHVQTLSCLPCACGWEDSHVRMICAGLGLRHAPLKTSFGRHVVTLALQRNHIRSINLTELVGVYPNLQHLALSDQRGGSCVQMDGLLPDHLDVQGI